MRHRLFRFLFLSGLGLTLPLATWSDRAEAAPVSAAIKPVQIYPYSPGMMYRLTAAPERVTDIALQPGEQLTAVAAGDTARWTVGDTTSGSGATRRTHILLKPFSSGLRTNLVITTDRRVYHLQLDSRASTAMVSLSWTYPQDDLIALQRADASMPVAAGLALGALRFGYRISGHNPSWRPVRAFDDGRQTFIEFPATIATGQAPPLFVIGDSGQAELVNYRIAGRYYVVDRLFARAELRLGAKRQSIVRIERDDASPRGQRRRRSS
ncbi:MAG: P-type conjugative transfer protein TrbG [Pseudomonadota bacterium]